MTIKALHSAKASRVLEKIGLAHRTKPESKRQVCKALQAGRHKYAADQGEHISPVCPLLFFITRSSMNIQICDEYFNAKYLAKYLCGPEERIGARVSSGGNDNTVNVEVDGIQNIKLGTRRTDLTADHNTCESGRIISTTESLW